MSSPFGRASNNWSTNGPNALPSARVDGRANPFAAPATTLAAPKVTPALSAFTFPAQPRQAPWGSAWAAQPQSTQPSTNASASPFAPAAPKTVFGSGSTSGVSTTTVFANAWGSFSPATSGPASTVSPFAPAPAPAPAAGSNGGFRLGQPNASTTRFNQQQRAYISGTSSFDWPPQQKTSTGNPFTNAGAGAVSAVGVQQPAANSFAPSPLWAGLNRTPADRFVHYDSSAPIRSTPTTTHALRNGCTSVTEDGFITCFIADDPALRRPVEKKPPPTAAPTPAWTFPLNTKFRWSVPSTASTEMKAPSAWTLPSTVSTAGKGPQSTWTFPTPVNAAAGGAKANTNASTASTTANNGFKFTWTPFVTPANAGTNATATGTFKFQWPTAQPASTPSIAAPTTSSTIIAPSQPRPQPLATLQYLIAQADVNPYGADSFGAGLVEQQVQAVLRSSTSASASIGASSPSKSTDRSVDALSLTPAPPRRSLPPTKRVGLSPNAMASPSATILRPKQPMMMLQRLSGSSRSSWTRSKFRRPGSLFQQ